MICLKKPTIQSYDLLDLLPKPATSNAPWRIFNIGNNRPTDLLRYIEVLEECLGRRAEKEYLPMQPGDVPATWADANALDEAVGYRPSTTVEVGVQRFVEWYREFYGVAAPAVAASADA